MYSWKDTDSAVSAAADRGKAALASGCLSGRPARTEEEEDGAGVDGGEETDAFAPLPSELSSTAKQFGKSAKDKRRLREKRRSTGVATLEGHQPLKSDELTTRNTSYNETPGIIGDDAVSSTRFGSIPSTVVDGDRRSVGEQQQRKPSHVTPDQTDPTADHRNHGRDQKTSAQWVAVERFRHQYDSEKVPSSQRTPDEPTGLAVGCSNASAAANPADFAAKNVSVRSFAAKRSILKTNSRPIISPKPEMLAAPSSAPVLSVFGQRSSEEVRLMSRISELEELLESEKKEKATLEKFLSARDLRIRELESQIETLNEDLDLADEDYLRLEEESRALTRALSQLNVV